MATSTPGGHRRSLPPSSAAYLRSSSASPRPTDRRPASVIARKPVPIAAASPAEQFTLQHSPVTPVKIDGGMTLPRASSAQIENYSGGDVSPPTLGIPDLTLDDTQPSQHDTGADRQQSSQHTQYDSQTSGHTASRSASGSLAGIHEEESQSHAKKSQSSSGRAPSGSHHSSSRGSLESTAQGSDSYEPLHYHHQVYQTSSRSRISPIQDPSVSMGNLEARIPLQRRTSAQSSLSDLNARGRLSPHVSPYLQARSSSRNSLASLDARPLSFVDLLNTSYPQPGPVPKQTGNDYLRSSVGNNASLLSQKQTFNMYLANVKKTDDPAVQYEFAVFMVNATMDMPRVEHEDKRNSASGAKDPEITRSRLLGEAKSILQRLADRSYPFAQYYLGDGYASGLFSKGKEDYDRAFSLFVAASKHGHVEACYRTALCYEFGWGTRVEASRAVQFYRQAASKNHPGAMLRMATACLSGDMGLGKRYREGIKWMKRAAESSDAQYNSAPYELGLLHETGYGDDVFADPSYAAQLFTKSADLGHVEANYRLGDAYEHGKLNCPRDPALSIHFYTNAAQQGHPLAMMALCAWYMVGAEPVLEKDESEAYEWARRAADLGMSMSTRRTTQ